MKFPVQKKKKKFKSELSKFLAKIIYKHIIQK